MSFKKPGHWMLIRTYWKQTATSASYLHQTDPGTGVPRFPFLGSLVSRETTPPHFFSAPPPLRKQEQVTPPNSNNPRFPPLLKGFFLNPGVSPSFPTRRTSHVSSPSRAPPGQSPRPPAAPAGRWSRSRWRRYCARVRFRGFRRGSVFFGEK